MLFADIKKFFSSPLAQRAAKGLRDGVQIAIQIDGEDFIFTKVKGKNQLIRGKATAPQISFSLSSNAMQNLVEIGTRNGTTLGQVGQKIFEGILSQQEQNKIKSTIHASFLRLWSSGYFSVLKVAGPELAVYLKSIGFSGMAPIKALWKKKG